MTPGHGAGRTTNEANPSNFVLRGCARVDERLSDDGQDGVDAVCDLNVQNKLRVLQNVDPEPQRETVNKQTSRRVKSEKLSNSISPSRCDSPVGLPDVHGVWIIDSVFVRHVIQKVEEEPDGDGRRTLCVEDGHKDVIHELLQRPL